MLDLVTLILLQLTYTISTTKPYVTYYWQTSSATDKVMDYWNHGPIYIPGLQNVYTITTRPPDIFPPWLTRGTTTPKTLFVEKTDLIDKKFVMLTKPTGTTSSATTTTTTQPTTTTPARETTIDNRTTETKSANQTKATQRPKPIQPQPSFEEVSNQGMTDPFSAFLRKFLRVLSVKSLSELPPLFKPFTSYMTELITDGDLKVLGDTVISFVKKMIEKLNELILTPDKLHTQCYQGYNMLSNRHTALDQDTNNLLNFLDDMYDEAEEEIMQIMLHETTKFPNTNTTAEEIAYSFVNNVFLLPMTRVNGTSRGDTLVSMLTAVVTKAQSPLRRDFGNSHRKKRSRNDLRDNNELNNDRRRNSYKAIRDNMENIDNILNKLKLGASSSDTSAYEYNLSEDVDETDNDKVEQVEDTSKYTINSKIQIINNTSDSDAESLSENGEYNKTVGYGQMDKAIENFKGIFENLEREVNYSGKSSSLHFRYGNRDKYQKNERTLLIPSSSLFTKPEIKGVLGDSVTQSPKKHKKTGYSYFSDDGLKSITKRSNELVHRVSKSQLKKSKKSKKEINPYFNKHPDIAETNNYHVRHQQKPKSKNKPTARIHLKREPVHLDTKNRQKVTTLKSSGNQVTKHPEDTEIISEMINILRNKNNNKNITQYNMDDLNIAIKEENADESDDSDTYSGYSSESSGHKDSKYEKLKRKYNILKRLSEQIVANFKHDLVNIKRERTSPEVINYFSKDENNNDILETATNGHRKNTIKNINLFLNDYNDDIDSESDNQRTLSQPHKLLDYKDIIRKSFALSPTTEKRVNVTTTEYSEAEKELKQYIYDAIRHMDFIHYNASRRNDDIKPLIGTDSHQTDVEAVLKTNIYKAVKKLLET